MSNPVLIVVTDTDNLVMLMNQASGIHGGVYKGRSLTSCEPGEWHTWRCVQGARSDFM